MLNHYLTQALRSLLRFKLTTTVNIVGLALGLVCFITTYIVLESLTNTDSHLPKARRIYALTQDLSTPDGQRFVPAFPQVAPPAARYLKLDLPGLEAVARAVQLGSLAVATEDRSLDLYAAAVDPEFARIFALKLVAGEAPQALAASHELVLTERAAQRLFGSHDVIGRHVRLQNRVDMTVTGVLRPVPSPSHMGDAPSAALRFDVLVPMGLLRDLPSTGGIGVPIDPDGDAWGSDVMYTYVLLPADGSVTRAALFESLRGFGERHMQKWGIHSNFGAVPVNRIRLASTDALLGGRAAETGLFLLDLLILLIACINYANLAVALATTRAKEIGIRKVLGAGQMTLMRQYMLEALLLGTAALGAVLLGTALAIPPLNRSFGLELQLPSLADPILWLLVIALLGGISVVGGAYPALVLARVRPAETLRAATVRVGPRFVPTVLVAIQFGAASFLLVVALMMFNQNRLLERTALRPDQDPVVVIGNDTRQLGIDLRTLPAELLRDSHIKAVSASGAPLWQSGGDHVFVGRSRQAVSTPVVSILNFTSHDFFKTLGLEMLSGRALDEEHGDLVHGDSFHLDMTRQPAVVLDRALIQQLGWASPNAAVGQLIYADGMPLRVVGVVENGFPRLIGPGTQSNLYMLTPEAAYVPIIRIARDDIPRALAHIDRVWHELVPKAPIRRRFVDDLFNDAYQTFAMLNRLLAGLVCFAFVIALMGLFGMAIHVASRRRREIGIRKTLGASAPRVVFMLLRDFARPVVVASIVAWPLAFLAGRMYLDLFTQRISLSAWPFVLGLVITVAIAWAAVGGQAVRAAAVKPAKALYVE